MTDPTDEGDSPSPEPTPQNAASAQNEFAEPDAREALFTAALAGADRVVDTAEAMRLQVMLAGFDAMLLEEEAQTGRAVHPDDAVVRAFLLHQAGVLRTSRGAVGRRLTCGRTLRDRLPRTWAVFLDGGTGELAADAAAAHAEGLTRDALATYDAKAAELVQDAKPPAIERELGLLRDTLDPDTVVPRHPAATGRRWVSAARRATDRAPSPSARRRWTSPPPTTSRESKSGVSCSTE